MTRKRKMTMMSMTVKAIERDVLEGMRGLLPLPICRLDGRSLRPSNGSFGHPTEGLGFVGP